MNYSKKEIGLALKYELSKGYNIEKISQWSYKIYLTNIRSLDHSTEEILEYLFRMADDPQFEFTEQELGTLAEMLINEEDNPIKKIIDIK